MDAAIGIGLACLIERRNNKQYYQHIEHIETNYIRSILEFLFISIHPVYKTRTYLLAKLPSAKFEPLLNLWREQDYVMNVHKKIYQNTFRQVSDKKRITTVSYQGNNLMHVKEFYPLSDIYFNVKFHTLCKEDKDYLFL